ncbi:glycosyltransferase family 9 protein [Sphingobacterium hungaricum]
MKRVLVTRFSAMGDVAMVASVLAEFQEQNPDTEVIVVTRKPFFAFFDGIPRIRFHAIEPKSKHKGFFGLLRLYDELKTYKADYFADLHNNLRTKFLTGLFKFNSINLAILDKGREEKKALTSPHNKVLKPLERTVERYADVFRSLGFNLTLTHQLKPAHRELPEKYQDLFRTAKPKIGIAPFAQHPYKVFPLKKMVEVIRYLSEHSYQVFIFGGGQQEFDTAENWSKNYSGITNSINQFSISEELDIIANLDLMVSMDSSGMHMASLVGVRCVSIWGATHPYAGFLGYGQREDDCVQVNHPNRPSSVYGNKPCICDGVEAIDLVTAEMVIDKIKSICE